MMKPPPFDAFDSDPYRPEKSRSDVLIGVVVSVVVAALLIPLALCLAFLCWGWAGRAFEFMVGAF